MLVTFCFQSPPVVEVGSDKGGVKLAEGSGADSEGVWLASFRG